MNEATTIDNISRSGLICTLSISVWNTRRYSRTGTAAAVEQTKAQAGSAKTIAETLDHELHARIIRVAGQMRRTHYFWSVPWAWGAQMVSVAAYPKHNEALSKLQREFLELRQAWAVIWDNSRDDVIAEQQQRLGAMFNPNDYPADIAALYSADWYYSQLPADDPRVCLKADQVADIIESTKKRQAIALNDSVADIWERIRVHAATVADVLSNDKRMHDSTLVTLSRDLADVAECYNLSGDPALSAAARTLRDGIAKYDAAALRQDPALRASQANDAESLARAAAQGGQGIAAPIAEPSAPATAQPTSDAAEKLAAINGRLGL